MAKQIKKKQVKKKAGTRKVTKEEEYQALIDCLCGLAKVNERIDRIVDAVSTSKSVKGL